MSLLYADDLSRLAAVLGGQAATIKHRSIHTFRQKFESDEERKQAKKERDSAWVAAHRASKRAYYQANKERISRQRKARYQRVGTIKVWWTKKEIKLLKKHFPAMPTKDLAVMLGRSDDSVWCAAKRRKLHKSSTAQQRVAVNK